MSLAVSLPPADQRVGIYQYEGCGNFKNKTHNQTPSFVASLPSPPSFFRQSKTDVQRLASPRYPPSSIQSTGCRRRRYSQCPPYRTRYPACTQIPCPRADTQSTVDKLSTGPFSPGTRRDLGIYILGVGESRRESPWGWIHSHPLLHADASRLRDLHCLTPLHRRLIFTHTVPRSRHTTRVMCPTAFRNFATVSAKCLPAEPAPVKEHFAS